MTGRDLQAKLSYIGMERDLRKLAIEDELTTPDKLAVISELEVCDLVANKYEMVFAESECVGLVSKDKIKEYNKIVKLLER